MNNPTITSEIQIAHDRVRQAEQELEDAIQRRALTFALANKHGASSGDIARATHITPNQVQYQLRIGHALLRRRHLRSVA